MQMKVQSPTHCGLATTCKGLAVSSRTVVDLEDTLGHGRTSEGHMWGGFSPATSQKDKTQRRAESHLTGTGQGREAGSSGGRSSVFICVDGHVNLGQC